MFIAALYMIAKIWKQPKCPSIEECIKKMWYIHTVEYYAVTKRNEIMNGICINMNIMLMRHQHHKLSLTCGIFIYIYICGNLKRDEMNFLAEQILTHRLKNLWFPKETGWGGGKG